MIEKKEGRGKKKNIWPMFVSTRQKMSIFSKNLRTNINFLFSLQERMTKLTTKNPHTWCKHC